jgi:hypothetical protein
MAGVGMKLQGAFMFSGRGEAPARRPEPTHDGPTILDYDPGEEEVDSTTLTPWQLLDLCDQAARRSPLGVDTLFIRDIRRIASMSAGESKKDLHHPIDEWGYERLLAVLHAQAEEVKKKKPGGQGTLASGLDQAENQMFFELATALSRFHAPRRCTCFKIGDYFPNLPSGVMWMMKSETEREGTPIPRSEEQVPPGGSIRDGQPSGEYFLDDSNRLHDLMLIAYTIRTYGLINPGRRRPWEDSELRRLMQYRTVREAVLYRIGQVQRTREDTQRVRPSERTLSSIMMIAQGFANRLDNESRVLERASSAFSAYDELERAVCDTPDEWVLEYRTRVVTSDHNLFTIGAEWVKNGSLVTIGQVIIAAKNNNCMNTLAGSMRQFHQELSSLPPPAAGREDDPLTHLMRALMLGAEGADTRVKLQQDTGDEKEKEKEKDGHQGSKKK